MKQFEIDNDLLILIVLILLMFLGAGLTSTGVCK